MDPYVKQYDKEHMKMAMLKHEETFREQVGELHRLYRIQKMLMKDMNRNGSKRHQMPEHQHGILGRSGAEEKRIPNQGGRRCHQIQGRPRRAWALDLERPAEDDDGVEQESEIELTLATGSRGRRKKEAASLTSDSATSFSSSSTESGGENSKFHEWGMVRMPDVNGVARKGECGVDGGASGEERVEPPPPWLFQCLSLSI